MFSTSMFRNRPGAIPRAVQGVMQANPSKAS